MAADARHRILDACERVIARAGIRGFRMQDVADECGVSIGLLAYHFGDRNGLLQAALDHVTMSAMSRAAAVSADTSAAARLTALLCSEFGDTDDIRAGSIAWNELRALAVFDPDQARAVAASTERWQRTVADLVLEASGDRGTPSDVHAVALHLTALVEGLSGRWLTGQVTAAAAQASVRAALRAWGM